VGAGVRQDVLLGGVGSDRFVLGDGTTLFYDDGNILYREKASLPSLQILTPLKIPFS
jgi:hypothetical protein